MGDGGVVGKSGPGWYWRCFVAKVLALKAAAVFVDGVFFHGAVSSIEHVRWRS